MNSSEQTTAAASKLIVVAHPDDESIFFGGLILSEPSTQWTVLCVTNGNSKDVSAQRSLDLKQACAQLGVKSLLQWDFLDVFNQRLDVAALSQRLSSLPQFSEIYTHGPLGEYGHPHHQDVCLAVHRAFALHANLHSVAFNCLPDRTVLLGKATYATKQSVVTEIYGTEFEHFVGLLPVSFCEGFVRLSLAEVECVHAHLTKALCLPEADFNRLCPHFSQLYRFVVQGKVAASADVLFASYFKA